MLSEAWRGVCIRQGVRASSVGVEAAAQGRVRGARSGRMLGWVTGMCGWAPKSQGRLSGAGSGARVSSRDPRQSSKSSGSDWSKNHVRDIVAIDFFVVPTATFRLLYVFLVMSHDRRRILHFNVTTSPSAQWTAQQLLEAFPYEAAPHFLLHDRDSIFGQSFVRRVESMGIREVVTAPGSPWQNPYCERLIGSIRRECLDHVIVLSERHLMRVLRSYASYYHSSRTHRSLDNDCPDPRPVESPEIGDVVALAQVGGLHHRYARRLAA